MKRHYVAATVLAFMLGWGANAYGQQTAEELYQAGLYQEEVQGNLESAIDLYRRILEDFPDNRAVGARAQLHVGLCYEKLGLQEAQQAYRRVIDEFPEHTDEVAVARDRLAGIQRALAELNRQPTFRKIEIASKPQNGVLSPDGNRLAFVSEGAVWVVPLHGKVDPDIAGEPVRLADLEGVWDLGSQLAWSADGEWIAANGHRSVYVIPEDGSDLRVYPMPERGSSPYGFRLSLSPDGQEVAFSALEAGTREGAPEARAHHIHVLSTSVGERRPMAFARGRMPAFSPDGELIAYTGHDGDLWVVPSSGGTPIRLASADDELDGPVWSPDGRFIAARHGSRETWVYPLSPDASGAGEPVKIALPRAIFGNLMGWTLDGELGVLMRTDEFYAIYTVPASGGRAVQVTPNDVFSYYPRWSPSGERIYLRSVRPDEDPPVRLGYVPAEGGEVVEVPWRSERALMSRVPGGGHNISPDGTRIVVSAAQEPYRSEEGVDVWTIPLDGGRPTRLTSDGSFEGYPCWSPDGQWIAFTEYHVKSEDEGFWTAIHAIAAEGGEIRQLTSEADSVGDGPIAYAPDGERIAFFSGGAIKAIPVQGGEPEVLVDGVRLGRHSQLAYSPDGSRIAHNFGGKIWITTLATGETTELQTGLPENFDLSEFGWSPDGEKIVFVSSMGGEVEFWLISDFLLEER